ncbi:MAG: alpha/beta fold hydrolase [Phycisphaerales bacterium]|nr:alpha/beta fold hydrolase [Phycisphaerales bacterium]
MPNVRRRRITSTLLGLLVAAAGNAGCGAFAVDNGGLFPLPTIHIVWPLPEQFGLASESVQLSGGNGEQIFGWFIPADDARATVIIHHGAVINRASTSDHYRLLNRNGFSVFVYDYQGFGESLVLAEITTVLPDADVVLQYVQQRDGPGADKIVIFGQSMGTLPAIAQAARSPDRVVGLVVEGSFSETLPPWAFTLLGITPDPIAFSRIPDELMSAENIVNVTMPKRFIQSRDDLTTPIAGARNLYELAPEPKSFVEMTGGHLQAVNRDPSYETALIDFLNGVVGP